MSNYQRQALTEGLVTGREALYQTSAEFHAAVDLLVQLLPDMVAGLALRCAREARQKNDRFQRELRRAMEEVTDG